jgi:hypothetical protein
MLARNRSCPVTSASGEAHCGDALPRLFVWAPKIIDQRLARLFEDFFGPAQLTRASAGGAWQQITERRGTQYAGVETCDIGLPSVSPRYQASYSLIS